MGYVYSWGVSFPDSMKSIDIPHSSFQRSNLQEDPGVRGKVLDFGRFFFSFLIKIISLFTRQRERKRE